MVLAFTLIQFNSIAVEWHPFHDIQSAIHKSTHQPTHPTRKVVKWNKTSNTCQAQSQLNINSSSVSTQLNLNSTQLHLNSTQSQLNSTSTQTNELGTTHLKLVLFLVMSPACFGITKHVWMIPNILTIWLHA